jgi:dTDP-4-dehydrorhamnose 3,5-epimerase
MLFSDTSLKGAYIIDIEKVEDGRGFFARFWCQDEFKANDLITNWVQGNLSVSKRKGTLRGLHYQIAPFAEDKLVRCTRGALFDVILDLRPDSSTFGDWFGVRLSADEHRMLYVPEGIAHGFLTLVDNTEASYLVSQFYKPHAEAGVRYNDPAFGIQWPLEIQVISKKDTNWPNYPRRTLIS